MKKILSLIIFLFFVSTNSCLAFSELYYLKNIKTSEVQPIVSSEIHTQKFNLVKENPYYAVSQDSKDKLVIVLQQSGDNMFYYYRADKNSKINKSILKAVKNKGIVCEQSFNTNIISIYDEIADSLIANSGNKQVYNFDEKPNPVNRQTNSGTAANNTAVKNDFFYPGDNNSKSQAQSGINAQNNNKIQKNTFSGYVAQIPTGTKLGIYLQNSINTANASKGDTVTAVTINNLTYNGQTVIPQGSLVYGQLTAARNATYGSRNGRVVINFNKIVTPEGETYNISAETIDFTVANDGKISSTAGNALQSAAVGALVGLLFGLLSDSSAGKSAAIGAGIGAGSSLVYSAAEKGVDAEIPSFTELELSLTSPLNYTINTVK